MKDHICTGCGQPHIIQDAHRESLTKIKINMLKSAASVVIETGVNDFSKHDLDPEFITNPNYYNNWSKLRFHGLIAKGKIKGRWLITRNGWSFLRGELELPSFVLVKDNHTQQDGRSDMLVSLLDVLKVGEYLETAFEYFDEDSGVMIGRRPVTPHQQEQESLFDVPPTERRMFA